jgi:cytochrome c oxidase subunit 1
MPRRIADYAASTGWQPLNVVSTIGALLLGVGTIPFLVAVVAALRGPAVAGGDPWEGNSLEWATSSPPPHHNFVSLPPIRSERPVFDERMRRAGLDRDGAPLASPPSGTAPSEPSVG